MPEQAARLDRETLVQLRALVRELHEGQRRTVPMKQLVHLTCDVRVGAAITIDFQAAQELGQPLVVLRYPPDTHPAPCLASLSRRERHVAALLAEGLTNKQIARRLFIALATVKDHVHRILVKSELPNRAAVAAAWKASPSQV